MITDETYNMMKKIIQDYERGEYDIKNEPYIIDYNPNFKYNPEYGDDRECECGHPYYRHFDSYEDMDAIGCKYCGCFIFKEKRNIVKERIEKINKIINN
jgi:hypothetical protein